MKKLLIGLMALMSVSAFAGEQVLCSALCVFEGHDDVEQSTSLLPVISIASTKDEAISKLANKCSSATIGKNPGKILSSLDLENLKNKNNKKDSFVGKDLKALSVYVHEHRIINNSNWANLACEKLEF